MKRLFIKKKLKNLMLINNIDEIFHYVEAKF